MIRRIATRIKTRNISPRVQLSLVEVREFDCLPCGVSTQLKHCWQFWREYGEQPHKIVAEFPTFDQAREAYEI